ncbi:Tetratricopeptide repeat-containing protein [Poseidonocella pacifica]|uniref:Tetratricopeptide repeat-containing protein n=1 Tax=Poseidonocella pacifica TaxID=871651 RepID=A0A1I0XIF4_9RHOB|nr:tetratricopeptide repeat protein [Poseidonocella pacifica]SFA99743.1 Tetratricopeptide repeat-containing protein [Poseidonocella pacifica]
MPIRKLSLLALVTAGALSGMTATAQPIGLAGAYLAARSAEVQGDYADAARYFGQAMQRDPGNPSLMQGALIASMSLGHVERAVEIARKMEGAGIGTQIAQLAEVVGHAAEENWEQLAEERAEGEGVGPLVDGLVSAWAHLGAGDVSEALASFDAVADRSGMRAFGLYHKALALASVGDFEGADELFSGPEEAALKSTRRAVIAHIEILSQLERNDQALSLLRESFDADLDIALQTMSEKLESGETLPFTVATSPRDGVAEVFYSVALVLQRDANEAYTLLYTRAAEYLRPEHTDAILLSAALLDEMGNLDLAVQAYKKVPADHPAHFAAELGRADALRRDERIEAAVEVLDRLARVRPDMADVQVSLGDILRQTEDYAGAAEAYTRGLDEIDAQSPRRWFVLYARGIAYERLDRWEEAEADFREALELNPEHPQVLNYLGYSLVEKQLKLDEALNMIETAVSKRPENGYIVDSLGWVLYKLGRFDEAVEHMERAAELTPVDPIVNDHLGDVYWAVGRKLEARFQWLRALSFDPEEEEAARIRKKLDVGLDQVLADEGSPPLVDMANGAD